MRLHRSTLILAATLVACGDSTGPELITELPRDLTVAEEALIQASNVFALDLLRAVHATETTSPNVFLSPLSASMALGMTMNGTDGQTWTQMRDVLGFGGLEEEEINDAYRDLIALLLDLDPNVTFGLGNSIWAREGVPFDSAFYHRVTEHFGAELQERDFADPATADAINAWVDDVTHGRITELVGQIPPKIIMYLINAIYFEGDWTRPFDPSDTEPGPFYLADGSTVTVPLMPLEDEFRTFWTGRASGIELPYGGEAFSAVAVLPGWDGSVDSMVARLDAETWAEWMAALDETDPHDAAVLMPRFELEYERTLNDDLIALGMADAFSEVDADFTRLTPLDLPAGQGPPHVWISEVKQNTFLKVDEEGTTAAAATSVAVGVDSGPPTFNLNRPFLFAIRERLTGTILFIGVIGDPSGSGS